jgi:hypothetical protein
VARLCRVKNATPELPWYSPQQPLNRSRSTLFRRGLNGGGIGGLRPPFSRQNTECVASVITHRAKLDARRGRVIGGSRYHPTPPLQGRVRKRAVFFCCCSTGRWVERERTRSQRFGVRRRISSSSLVRAREFISDLILKACEITDFWVFRPESNQRLSRRENAKSRINSRILGSRAQARTCAAGRGVANDGRASMRCVHPSRRLLASMRV